MSWFKCTDVIARLFELVNENTSNVNFFDN